MSTVYVKAGRQDFQCCDRMNEDFLGGDVFRTLLQCRDDRFPKQGAFPLSVAGFSC
jgi:hypothetical protein